MQKDKDNKECPHKALQIPAPDFPSAILGGRAPFECTPAVQLLSNHL